MNLCNNTAEVKDANFRQQRAYIHFSDLFQRESNKLSIYLATQTFHQRCILASLALNKVSS